MRNRIKYILKESVDYKQQLIDRLLGQGYEEYAPNKYRQEEDDDEWGTLRSDVVRTFTLNNDSFSVLVHESDGDYHAETYKYTKKDIGNVKI